MIALRGGWLNSPKLCFLICIILISLRLVWPGETPFNGDERDLVSRALSANQAGEWVTHGLRGTRGVDYGPVPIWFYQAVFLVTDNLLNVVRIKAFVVSLMTLAAVFRLASLVSAFPVWATCIPFLSPYFWMYSRDLWDNSWMVPVSALFFASYLQFLANPRRQWLAITAFWAVVAVQIHLFCLPLLTTVAFHFFVCLRRWWTRHLPFLFVVGLFAAAALYPYVHHWVTAGLRPVAIPFGPGVLHFVFGLLGTRVLTAVGFEYFLGWDWYVKGLPLAIAGISAFAVWFSAVALVPTVYGARNAWLRISRGSKRCFANVDGAVDTLVLGAVAMHVIMVGVGQLINHPHYYGGVWMAFYVLVARGYSELTLRNPRWEAISRAYLGAMFISLCLVLYQVRQGVGQFQPHFGQPIQKQSVR